MYTNRSSHWRCPVRKGVLRNFAKFTGKQLCQSASVLTNELLHVYVLSKFLFKPLFFPAKLSFSYFRQVNLMKSSYKMVKQNPMIIFGLKMSHNLRSQSLYHSLSLVVPLVRLFINNRKTETHLLLNYWILINQFLFITEMLDIC